MKLPCSKKPCRALCAKRIFPDIHWLVLRYIQMRRQSICRLFDTTAVGRREQYHSQKRDRMDGVRWMGDGKVEFQISAGVNATCYEYIMIYS